MKLKINIFTIIIGVFLFLAGLAVATSPMGLQKYQNNNYCSQRLIQLFTANNDSNTTAQVEVVSGTITTEGNVPTYGVSGATLVRANATNTAVFTSGTNWLKRKVINPTTSAIYVNYSTNAAASTNYDDVIPPSVATNTYDSYIEVGAENQAQITLSTTGATGYGWKR